MQRDFLLEYTNLCRILTHSLQKQNHCLNYLTKTAKKIQKLLARAIIGIKISLTSFFSISYNFSFLIETDRKSYFEIYIHICSPII